MFYVRSNVQSCINFPGDTGGPNAAEVRPPVSAGITAPYGKIRALHSTDITVCGLKSPNTAISGLYKARILPYLAP